MLRSYKNSAKYFQLKIALYYTHWQGLLAFANFIIKLLACTYNIASKVS